MSLLKRSFYSQETEIVAKQLLGKLLARRIGKKTISGKIVETEAYVGPHDLACHASKGRTKRTEVMFGLCGYWYIYMIYGFYYCLNIVTREKDYPAAVLIRALEPVDGVKEMIKNRNTDKIYNLTNGPGKLCQALEINKSLNCSSAVSFDSGLYIEDIGIKIANGNIIASRRVGVDYAKEWRDKPLRYYMKDSSFVSRVV